MSRFSWSPRDNDDNSNIFVVAVVAAVVGAAHAHLEPAAAVN